MSLSNSRRSLSHIHRSVPDTRDHVITFSSAAAAAAPSSALTVSGASSLPVFDQGQIGSCTANASVAMMMIKNRDSLMGSRMFVYYNTRSLEGTTSYDSGASLRDTLKSLNKYGMCREASWPYRNYLLVSQPTAYCYQQGAKEEAVRYATFSNTITNMKTCLQNNYPFVFGMVVYQSFMTQQVANTGIIPVPNTSTEKQVGGHALLCIGYDDSKQCFLVRNSWGTSWGIQGNCWIPYVVLSNPNLTFDLWVLYTTNSLPATATILPIKSA